MAVHLAAKVADLDEPRQLSIARRLELASVLAQLGRDEAVAEEGVERLLVPEGLHLARLDHGDAVLGNREPAALGLLSQGHVVLLRAREVLEQIAVALGRDDAEVEAQALVRDHGCLGVTVGDDLEHPGQPDEVGRQRRRIGRCRDHVEIAERLATAARAPGLGHVDRGRVRTQCLDDLAHDGQPDPQQAAAGLVASLALGQRFQDLRLGAPADPGERPQPLPLGCGLQLRERRHAELAPDPGRGLRAQPG